MSTPLLLIGLAVLAANAADAAEPLGGAFAGWRPSRHADSWTVADGVLRATNDAERQGSILWTEQAHGDFVMELEFRFGAGTVDSGVFVRHEQDQIQLGESGSLKRDMTASPYIIGAGYPVEAEGVGELLRSDEWNAMLIVAVGARYDVWLNGTHVMDYTSETAIPRGPIGLQIHPDREMRIDFRNVRVVGLRRE